MLYHSCENDGRNLRHRWANIRARPYIFFRTTPEHILPSARARWRTCTRVCNEREQRRVEKRTGRDTALSTTASNASVRRSLPIDKTRSPPPHRVVDNVIDSDLGHPVFGRSGWRSINFAGEIFRSQINILSDFNPGCTEIVGPRDGEGESRFLGVRRRERQ